MNENIWECKIGGPIGGLSMDADFSMRQAVAKAYREITGEYPQFIFSGWASKLTESQRAVVENRLPRSE